VSNPKSFYNAQFMGHDELTIGQIRSLLAAVATLRESVLLAEGIERALEPILFVLKRHGVDAYGLTADQVRRESQDLYEASREAFEEGGAGVSPFEEEKP